MGSLWGRFGKSLAQVAAALLAIGIVVTTGDGHVSGEEWVQVTLAGGSAVLVYLVPAVPEWPWAKTAVAGVLVGVEGIGAYALDGISSNDILLIAAGVLGFLLTGVAPAVSMTEARRQAGAVDQRRQYEQTRRRAPQAQSTTDVPGVVPGELNLNYPPRSTETR